jgi:hypothetical protein
MGSRIRGANSDRSRKSVLWAPISKKRRLAGRDESGRQARSDHPRVRGSGPGTGLALEGPGFYVWDEEPECARETARELTLALAATGAGAPGEATR